MIAIMGNLLSNPSFSALASIVLAAVLYLVCAALKEQRLKTRKIHVRSSRRRRF